VDSLYKQLETNGAASVGQLLHSTARALIKRNRIIRTFKDWALQTLDPDFQNPYFIFMGCILLRDFASLSSFFPMKCNLFHKNISYKINPVLLLDYYILGFIKTQYSILTNQNMFLTTFQTNISVHASAIFQKQIVLHFFS